MSAENSPSGLAALPDEVRSRVLGLTADVLPSVPKLPASLRKVADFAPARRARLGGTAIRAALEADDEFRERVAAQVVAKLPAPLSDLTAAPLDADPAELAALSWLVRPDGWETLLAEASARVAARAATAGAASEADLERLRGKVEAAEQALREARTRHRAELADLKAENTRLRRTLGETRSALRDANTAAEKAEAAADEARRQAEVASSAGEKEIRQLRSQLERLEAEAQSDRRAARSDRDEATIRARLLLDAVIDAATGLRRELALPPISGAPADRIEGELATEGARTPTSAGSLGPTSPALLEQYLTMPRARLIVDGYNVSKTAWGSSSLEAQRTRLLNGLAPLVARTGAETTVVFDAGASSSRPVVSSPRGVKVRFSPEGVIADDVIRDLVSAEPEGRVVVVVTSDQAVARDVVRAGARSVAAEALVALITRNG
jgi:predicted RNA-binding protein with PIN domain